VKLPIKLPLKVIARLDMGLGALLLLGGIVPHFQFLPLISGTAMVAVGLLGNRK